MVTGICRNFLLYGNEENRWTNSVVRDIVCQPRSTGGLSDINLFLWNKAAISKFLWAIAQKKDKLWVHTHYIKDKDLDSMATPKHARLLDGEFRYQMHLYYVLQALMRDTVTYSLSVHTLRIYGGNY